MNPLASITADPGTVGSVDQLQDILRTPQGAKETQAFQQTLANLLGNLLSQGSSIATADEDAPVVPTGSSLQPLQVSMLLAQINQAGER